MRTLTLNIDDSIFQKVIRMLESFPGEQLEIVDDNPTQEDLVEFAEDLRAAFVEIKETENGKRRFRTWEDVRDDL